MAFASFTKSCSNMIPSEEKENKQHGAKKVPVNSDALKNDLNSSARALQEKRCKSNEAHPIEEAEETCSERALQQTARLLEWRGSRYADDTKQEGL